MNTRLTKRFEPKSTHPFFTGSRVASFQSRIRANYVAKQKVYSENQEEIISDRMIKFVNSRLDEAIKNTKKTTAHVAQVLKEIEQRHSI